MRLALCLAMMLAIPLQAGPRTITGPVAMVIDAQGEMRVGDESRSLEITHEVQVGASLKLKAGARLTLLVYGTGEEVRLTGPGSFAFDAKGMVSGPVVGIRRTKGPGLSLKESLKPGGLAQASLVMRGPFDIDLEEPAEPTIRSPRPTFRWAVIKGATAFAFSLRLGDGTLLYSTTTSGNHLDLPAGMRLQPGTRYRWELSTNLPGVRVLHSASDLEVLDPARAATLDRLQVEAGKGFSQRLLYAATLQVCGLHTEAKLQWRALAALRPEDPSLRSYAR
jgi:hypothetical protein